MTRVVFITGASQNTGRTMAEHFARRGDVVVVNGRSADHVADTVEKIRAADGQAHGCVGDIGSPDEVDRMVSETEEAVGPVDVLVHSATARKHAPIAEISFEDWSWVIIGGFESREQCQRASAAHVLASELLLCARTRLVGEEPRLPVTGDERRATSDGST